MAPVVLTPAVYRSAAVIVMIVVASVFVVSPGLIFAQGEVAGPYTSRGPNGDGEFWSHTLRGSSLTIQLA